MIASRSEVAYCHPVLASKLFIPLATLVGRPFASPGGMANLKKMSERAFEFGCHLIDEFRWRRPSDDVERHIWRELLRAGTSVAANTAESGGAQSHRDFIQKFQIALKEGKESLVWLRFLRHACPDRASRVSVLYRECDEIVAILVASLKTAKRE